MPDRPIPPDASRRLFVGLFVPEAAASELHATVRGLLRGAGFRFVPPEEIHLTLRFLGQTPEAEIGALREGLARSLAGMPAPRLRLARTGSFPETGSARVLWVGLDEDPGTEGRLAALATAAAGPGADPFQPHLTVARPARQGRCLPPEDFRRLRLAIRWLPREVRLVESRPGESGEARFPVLERFQLTDSA
jgi:2'-5' RNA ligase